MITVEQLRAEVAADTIDNVIVAVPDLQGRLQGSRLDGRHFLDETLHAGFPACVYLLATDVEMNTRPGYAVDAAEAGFGDLQLVPDLTTLRRLPWDDGTALVLADARWPGGGPVPFAPAGAADAA